jgi:hypothetical protein
MHRPLIHQRSEAIKQLNCAHEKLVLDVPKCEFFRSNPAGIGLITEEAAVLRGPAELKDSNQQSAKA